MKALRIGQTAAVLSVAALALTACGSNGNTGATSPAADGAAAVTGTLTGTGASSVGAAMVAWAEEFAAANSGAQVNYTEEGSGAGRTGLIDGKVDFAASDAYLTDEELAASEATCGPDGAFDVPIYVSPIAVAFNLEGVDTLNLDADTIASIFAGKITTWNDEAIAALNEGVTLPDTKITVVHRNDKSGTTENFTDYLAQAAPSIWTEEKSGDWPGAFASESAKGTSGVVDTVAKTAGAITYADASRTTGLGIASVKVGEEFSAPTAEGAAKAADTATAVEGRAAHDIAFDLDRTSDEAGVYPISLVTFGLFCSTYADQETADLVKAFGTYITSAEGQEVAAADAGSSPLSAELSERAAEAIATISVK
ncbi:phosphate-binding protein PstS [Zafaria cholistanensis]|uniref:Phosphate-binding protein n=1 Tax=Zafaria cholistanensis TaxID=1682741 RepID=A0A5A7NUV9_9MICC|nr:phosphate ABC transporter substrate-binding protein PstS [Zafaria cholistanensis]GER24082.1 phosphate-binding protein PstS [Zafaria cholistanensis]